MPIARLLAASAAVLLCAAAARGQALADEQPKPQAAQAPEAPPRESPVETAIPVPVPAPSGLLIAWKPTILTVRLDKGQGSEFGSDKLQLLRGLARYTVMAKEGAPFFGRFELEGGQFETDQPQLGSRGYDFTVRALGGAATRLFPGVLFIAAVGGITRYQHGSATGGAPTLGQFGILANAEIEYRFLPTITASIFGEAAVSPYPYGADKNLGDLSDASEVRGRLQLSWDLTPTTAVDFGYDFTRWHATFVNSTILGGNLQALIVEAREYSFSLGLRLKL